MRRWNGGTVFFALCLPEKLIHHVNARKAFYKYKK